MAQCLAQLGVNSELSQVTIERLLAESSAKSMDELYADLGIGKRMPALVARHIFGLLDGEIDTLPTQDNGNGELDPVTIYGSEGVSVTIE